MIINKKLFVYDGVNSKKPTVLDKYFASDAGYKFLGVAEILIDTEHLTSLEQLRSIELSKRLETLEREYDLKRAAAIDAHHEKYGVA